MPTRTYQVSFYNHAHGGYSSAKVRADSQKEAHEKAAKQVTRFYPKGNKPRITLSHLRAIGKNEEMDLILNRLWSQFPSVYLALWKPGLKSADLIALAKKKLKKDKWAQIWI